MPRILSLFVSISLISSASAAEPYSAEQIAKAEATFKDVLGDEHTKMAKVTKVTERSKYAKQLLDKAKQSKADPVLADVIRNKALPFAGNDATGIEVALEIHKSNLEFPARKGISLEKIAELSEKLIADKSVSERPKFAAEILKNYRESITEYEKASNPVAALAAVAKARTFARKWTPSAKETFASLDADEKRLQPKAAEQAEVEKFKPAVEKNPGDAKARMALGLAYLKANRLTEAGEQLKEAGPEWKSFGEFAATKTASPRDVLGVAYDLAIALPAEEKRARLALFEFAVEQGELVRNDPNANWSGLREKYIDSLERLSAADANRTATLAPALVTAYLEWAEEQLEAKRIDSATISVNKARAACKVAKASDAKELLAEVEHLEKTIKVLVNLEADAEKWKGLAAQGPLDAKSCSAYGIALLRLGKPTEAAVYLVKGESKTAQQLGAILAAKGKIPQLEVGEALRNLAGERKGDDKHDLLALAREAFESALQNPENSTVEARIRLLIAELPSERIIVPQRGVRGNVITWLDENSEITDAIKKVNSKIDCSWELTNAFSGKGYLLCKPNVSIDANALKPVKFLPDKSEEGFRFLRFAWRVSAGGKAKIHFICGQGKNLTYTIGTPPGTSSVAIAEKATGDWELATRDLVKDFPSASGEMQGIYVVPDANGIGLDSIQFAKSAKDFPKLLRAKGLGK